MSENFTYKKNNDYFSKKRNLTLPETNYHDVYQPDIIFYGQRSYNPFSTKSP
jgi:hypothetical protein